MKFRIHLVSGSNIQNYLIIYIKVDVKKLFSIGRLGTMKDGKKNENCTYLGQFTKKNFSLKMDQIVEKFGSVVNFYVYGDRKKVF